MSDFSVSPQLNRLHRSIITVRVAEAVRDDNRSIVKLALMISNSISLIIPSTRSAVSCALMISVCLAANGCALIPDTRTRDSLHNPFPQLKRVAVLPFFNQSDSPHVDGDEVAKAYYAALQSIPGFEVLPVGVTAVQWRSFAARYGEPRTGVDFQRLAQMLDVEAIVVGSVTDFDTYYPPRMALTVNWYAANEGFHAIPPGYGLPWGTENQDKVPARIVREAEFELARSQLKTQEPQAIPMASRDRQNPRIEQSASNQQATASPNSPPNPMRDGVTGDPRGESAVAPRIARVQYQESVVGQPIVVPRIMPDGGELPHAGFDTNAVPMPPHENLAIGEGQFIGEGQSIGEGYVGASSLPADWPEPTDLIPDPPQPVPPAMIRQHEPVLTHTRMYRGDDPYFTARLADYVETGDDARGVSWQGYIKRSEDFIRFCCHLHIVEMLESRGGQDPSDLILRWPVSRY